MPFRLFNSNIKKGDYLATQATPEYCMRVLRSSIDTRIADYARDTENSDKYEKVVEGYRAVQINLTELWAYMREIEKKERELGFEPEMQSLGEIMYEVQEKEKGGGG